MSLVQLKPAEVADLFVDLCSRLRAMGATHVDAFGFRASFAPVHAQQQPEGESPATRDTAPAPEVPPDPRKQLTSDEAREAYDRAGKLFGGAR